LARFDIAIVPVGRVDPEEIEATAARAAKVLHEPLELRAALAVPHTTEDAGRGQHRAAALLTRLREEVAKLGSGRLVGAADASARPAPKPGGFVFLTDVDLFTAASDGVFAALLRPKAAAVVSVRRLREAFYRRAADPVRQRARLAKELLRMVGRLAGAPECSDAHCVLAPSKTVADVDAKDERFCRACEQRLFEGKLSL
jgi:predicted Zn-dependent protease